MPRVKGLIERLHDGENIICAEGYMWELERRGFVCCGDFTPEVVLDYPERVRALHEEFILAGSDVVEAFTYYAHEGKLKTIGRESDFEALNLSALKMARELADKSGKLMAGNICNSTTFDADDPDIVMQTKKMFKIQIEWALQGGADYIIAETFNELAEAQLALEAIKEYGKGLPCVVTMAPYSRDTTLDDVPLPEALRQLEVSGADVVGFNCGRGPETMLPLLRKAREICKGPLAALPACFRTNEEQKCFYNLTDPRDGKPLFPGNLGCVQSSRGDVRKFAKDAKELGVAYIGLCCGASPSLLREVAEAFGRTTELSRFAPSTDRNYYMKSKLSSRERRIKDLIFGTLSTQV